MTVDFFGDAERYAASSALTRAAVTASALDRDDDADVGQLRAAWELTNTADHEQAPLHLVGAVRAKLVMRAQALFFRRHYAALATTDQPLRSEAFARVEELGKLYVRFIEDDAARMIRLFHPFMQVVALEIDGDLQIARARGEA
jgi:hypothetical protein